MNLKKVGVIQPTRKQQFRGCGIPKSDELKYNLIHRNTSVYADQPHPILAVIYTIWLLDKHNRWNKG
jgi:hypothetical protein